MPWIRRARKKKRRKLRRDAPLEMLSNKEKEGRPTTTTGGGSCWKCSKPFWPTCLKLIKGTNALAISGSSLSPETASPPCSNKTDLLPRRSITADGGGMSNVLVVSSSVGMLHRTDLIDIRRQYSTEQIKRSKYHHTNKHQKMMYLYNSSSEMQKRHRSQVYLTKENSGKEKRGPGGAVVGVVTDDDGVVAGGAGKNTAVANVVLDVADDSTLRNGAEGKDVADHEGGLAATVDELAGVHPFGGDEELLLELVPEWMAEGDAGKRGATARVVHDLGDHALKVAIALPEVEAPETRGPLAVVRVGAENRPRSLPLCSDHASHLGGEAMAEGGRYGEREKKSNAKKIRVTIFNSTVL
ncbi:hypothetical protein C4D60_Mb05t20530 [Musa balbisiana]|uniref:Uncharacterized protein n=1 Tax=Musa balbisiana TaxID=52838 RepID=A0A4S8JXM5_MUSBA|nr:hypothetical protein C4D60_Mb05t20530 [Musa balbisiana]